LVSVIWKSTSARDEVIFAADLYAVARIIEETDIGAGQLRAEGLHRPVKRRLVEIKLRAAAHQRKTECAQGIGQKLGVVSRIVERWDAAIGRIADHQRDALFRKRRANRECRQHDRHKQQQQPCAPAKIATPICR
jgi:hypothetical protein